jgi:hypothetical protein
MSTSRPRERVSVIVFPSGLPTEVEYACLMRQLILILTCSPYSDTWFSDATVSRDIASAYVAKTCKCSCKYTRSRDMQIYHESG